MNYPMDEKKQTGERLRKVREREKCSQESFATELGMSLTNYSKMERGNYNIAINTLRKLHEKYNISIDYLLFGQEPDKEKVWVEIKNMDDSDKMRILLRLLNYFGNEKTKHYAGRKEEVQIFEHIEKFLDFDKGEEK